MGAATGVLERLRRAAHDERLDADAARFLGGATVTEVPGSHSIYVSNPGAVARLIAQAARSLAPTTGSVA